MSVCKLLMICSQNKLFMSIDFNTDGKFCWTYSHARRVSYITCHSYLLFIDFKLVYLWSTHRFVPAENQKQHFFITLYNYFMVSTVWLNTCMGVKENSCISQIIAISCFHGAVIFNKACYHMLAWIMHGKRTWGVRTY